MKKLKKSILCLLALTLLASCSNKPPIQANYAVIPLPQQIHPTQGKQFTLNSATKIVYPQGNNTQKQTAQFLADYIELSTGMKLSITDLNKSENAIVLQTGYDSKNPEAYHLTINNKQIVVDGASEAGTFYGVQTLRKSMPADARKNTVEFPPVDIQDHPRFGYRGMMLDVGRHFFPVEFIKKYIDILALHNINRFHWHLTEDQGWRIEIKKYPELTTIGSQRAQTVIGRNSGKFDNTPYGGFYTQDEIKDVVNYAQKRFITIVPEIDLPGHMLAALAAYPHLGCTGGPYKVGEQWGVYDDVLCAGNDSVYTFLEDVFDEVLDLFPSQYIHVGGDECPKVRWEKCPKCQAKIKELGLKSDAQHTKENRLQSYVISRIEKYLNSKGRQIIGWDEILEGGLAPNATVMSWRGIEGGIAAAQQHHNVVMSPNGYLYFDAYQSRDTQNEPLAIGGYTPIEKVYNYEPIPQELTPEQAKYITGVQANLWTEYIPNSKQAEYMVLPRMAALAEIQWTEPANKNYQNFLTRLAPLLKMYQNLGYNYATTIMDIYSETNYDVPNGTIELSLMTYDHAPIYYTLDGTEPTEKSQQYTAPIKIKTTTEVRAIAMRGTEKSKPYADKFTFNKATLKDVTLLNQPHRSYTFNGAITLVDGKRGSLSFGNGEWLGFVGKDMVATIDLKTPTEISSVTTGTYLETSSWIFGATGYTISLSDDGKTYRQVFDKTYPVVDETTPSDRVIDLKAEFAPQKARFVRVTVKPTASIPVWHDGKGSPAFVFIDEIAVD